MTYNYEYNKCYDELYKAYETKRLILQRSNQNPDDYKHLANLIFNRNVNLYFQRPIMYLEDINKAYEYIERQANFSITFTIKLKSTTNLIPIGQIGYYYADKDYKEIGIFYFIGEEYQRKGYAAEAACPLIKHLFENLPLTSTLKIDFVESNIGSRKIALKVCNDILKSHPDYLFRELTPFTEKYTLLSSPKVSGCDTYFFEGFDRKCYVYYPYSYFNHTKYFEVRSNGFYILKPNDK